MRHHEGEPAAIVRARLPVDRDVFDIAPTHSSFTKTIIDRIGGKAGPMLHPPKTLFLRRRDQFAVDDQTRRRITVESV